MSFFPTDPAKVRPSKILFHVETLREVDRAVQEGLGGYSNRHELVNDLVEQGLIDLRYPDGEEPIPLRARSQAEEIATPAVVEDGVGAPSSPVPAGEAADVEPLGDIHETRIAAPPAKGVVIENELAAAASEPMFGMHNRDAPSAWGLSRLAAEACQGPVALSVFYEKATTEAWGLAARLAPLEVKGGPKLAVMLPRNQEKPQSAADGFRAFALGQVARKPDDNGKLAAWGPFYQWGAVGIVGDVRAPKIGLTEAGWELVELFDGLDFSLPHSDEIAQRFLAYLGAHAPADLWGFRTALEGAAQGAGRAEMNEYFRKRLPTDFPDQEWKGSVAESVASGYVSRARAWGFLAPKLDGRRYAMTPAGENTLNKLAANPEAA